jgi:trans-2,3-dihydro-3-hydroxyanthranilate isomerase
LELGVGPIPCNFSGDLASFTTEVPLEIAAKPEVSLVARSLNIEETQIVHDTHPPIQAGVGLTFTIVELDSRQTLASVQPVIDAVREGAERYPTGLDFALFAYVREGSQIDARMFAPLDNMPEDPATGSASAALAALLHDFLGAPQELSITQGEDMGRKSIISAATAGTPAAVTISGTAVKTMDGQMFI